jgi:hypothetical protein
MRANIRSNLLKSFSGAIAVGLIVFAFQNCGKAGFDQTSDETSITKSDKDTSAPFAFNATFDQITYNSCFGVGLSTNPAYFTLKAGAYESGGVNMTANFLSYVKANVKPAYPATEVTVEQMKSFVGETAENVAPTLQVALRTRGAPQQVRNPTGSSPSLNTDFVNLMTDLTDDRIMEPIFRSPGGVVNYFPLAVNQVQRVMEAKITYNGDEGVAYSLRNDLSNSGMLALTYTGPSGSSAFAARVPASASASNSAGAVVTDSSVAYGRGYNLIFAADIAPMTQDLHGGAAAPPVAPNSRNPNNILVAIQEANLENPSASTSATWSCAQARRYVVVQAEDVASFCPADHVDRMWDANYRRELEIVRRHLPAAQWDVSVDRHCVVPKSGPCYVEDQGAAKKLIEYDQTKECFQNIEGLTNTAITKRCAQYVSICLRN